MNTIAIRFLASAIVVVMSSCSQPCLTIIQNKYLSLEYISRPSGWIVDRSGCKIYNPYPDSNETIEYEGECSNTFANGNGKVTWFKNGVNTEVYQGQFLLGKYHGKGLFINQYGRYEGEFKDHLEHGFGVFLDSSDLSIYTGFFWEGRKDGTGSIVYPNGDRFEGYFLKGLKSNLGYYQWKNGETYRGEFQFGSRNGKGVYYKNNGDSLKLEYESDRLLTKLQEGMILQEPLHIQTAPVLLKNNSPEYPCEAKFSGIEGKVVIKVLVGEMGSPIKYTIVEATNESFKAAAINAVMQNRFKPAQLDGKPIKAWYVIPYTFRFRN